MPSEADIYKKTIERRVLEAARRASTVIPSGEAQDFERPDFKLLTAGGVIGIEVTELLPSAGNDSFASALADSSFQAQVVELAEQRYYQTPDAKPVKVTVY